MILDGCALKCWSNRQVTVALSSGEAELYAATKAAAEMGWKVESMLELRMESSAARGMAGRRGLGKTRHIDVRRLWLQEVIEKKKIVTKKVLGVKNPADVLTKLKSYKEASSLMEIVNLEFL